MAFVSINEIAEPATLHSDQPFLFADPPDHIPPLPLPLPLFPSGTYRLTLRVPRLSERKRRRVDAYKGHGKQTQTERASARRSRLC